MSFDLQLFAEEEVGAQMAQPAGQEVAQPVEQQAPESVGQETAPEPKYGLVTDEKTGRKVVREIVKEEGTPENTTAEEAQTEPLQPEATPLENKQPGLLESAVKQQGEQTQMYGEQEFLLALQLGDVDESRVPPQHAMQYGAYKARIGQQPTQQVQQPVQPTQQEDTQKVFYARIAAAAHEQALTAVGMTQEEYEAVRYSDDASEKLRAYNAAYQWNEGEIVKAMQRQQEVQQRATQERQEIYRDIHTRIGELKVQEPHFAAIDKLMLERYQTLPYKEAQEVAQTITALHSGTITPQQCKVLEKYYEDTRLAFYAQQNNLPQTPKPKPPTVETPGSGESLPQSVDFAAMRNMNVRERRAFISNYFQGKNK